MDDLRDKVLITEREDGFNNYRRIYNDIIEEKIIAVSYTHLCKTLGENYSQEAIVERIAKEDLSFYQSQNEEKQAVIVKCYVKRYRRAKMSGLQKRYYAKLYRIGKLKKKPYSQVWKYKEDIRKMHKLQEEYLFLSLIHIYKISGTGC